ncbi:ABC transporter ATP-binding protein [Xylophilus sp. GOD-11R]|uniref:ABC transporter ATP-binding protein n=1 Tax=Xylophilus sp. GOD-11R TaxID=3089814 RepID=UPI00298C2A60|nr:ABC transporter ATP-binding protein [Xylophilus sp. GOD-11R]WPB59189.1 ABC transporter ATP-binding protein [Xylophilus sp. GOD-11R]
MLSTPGRPLLSASRVSYSYPGAKNAAPVLEDFSLSVNEGEFFCLLGPSGCGKTSILNLLAGFTQPDAGTISLGGQAVSRADADRGVVFQNEDALFPWLNALQNVSFGLRMKGMDAAQTETVARRFIDAVHLTGHEKKFPGEMSGGMKQRVQIARVLANDPKILLMDEPFGAVDAQTRTSLQDELAQIWEADRKTVLFITHDISEAILLADRIGIVSKGPRSHLLQVLDNDLPRPRRRSSPRFGELWEEINALLH